MHKDRNGTPDKDQWLREIEKFDIREGIYNMDNLWSIVENKFGKDVQEYREPEKVTENQKILEEMIQSIVHYHYLQ